MSTSDLKRLLIDLDDQKMMLSNEKLLKGRVPVGYILNARRSIVVAVISAYDRYIHSIVYRGMIEAGNGTRPATKQFNSFKVSILSSIAAQQGTLVESWLGPEIISQISWKPFQKCDDVQSILLNIHQKNIWDEVSIVTKKKREDIVAEINSYVERRNKIVHESDVDPVSGVKRDISYLYCQRCISAFIGVCKNIDRIVF